MTLSHTRRQLLHQAVEKEVLAVAFDNYAALLETVFKGVPTEPRESGSFWKGPAAERYLVQARTMANGIAELREDCTAAAARLRRRAARLREEAAQAPDV